MNNLRKPEVQNAATDISPWQKMLSAVSGSLLTSLLVTPLDVVRVRLQSQSSVSTLPNPQLSSKFSNLPPNLGVTTCCREVFWVNNASPFCVATNPSNLTSNTAFATLDSAVSSNPFSSQPANCAIDETRRRGFTSTFDGLRKIARNEGLTSLWRGLSPTLVMAIPANVIYFTGYDTLRSSAHSPIRNHIPEHYAPLVAGSVARVAAATAISPIEMFRTRMQAATSGTGAGVFTETFKGLRKLVRVDGYTSLWRGLTLTMWRDVPFSGLYWWGYEAVRDAITNWRDPAHLNTRHSSSLRNRADHTTTFIDSFAAGATSGAVASVITTPFDVGKTRQQVIQHEPKDSFRAGAIIEPRAEERSMPRFLYSIWKEEGLAGLFRGWTPRMLKVAPACAIMISSYEIGKNMASGMNERRRIEKER